MKRYSLVNYLQEEEVFTFENMFFRETTCPQFIGIMGILTYNQHNLFDSIKRKITAGQVLRCIILLFNQVFRTYSSIQKPTNGAILVKKPDYFILQQITVTHLNFLIYTSRTTIKIRVTAYKLPTRYPGTILPLNKR